MKNKLFEMLGLIGIFLIAVFLFNMNNNQIGKYVPFGSKMILNTTNGTVYIPTNYDKSGIYKWEKKFSFDRKENN